MERLSIAEVEPEPEGDTDIDRRPLTDPLGATDVAVNYYALDPGESFVGGLHAHLDQEEIFFVLDGTVTFEVTVDPAADTETVDVEANEVVRFEPGDYQQGRNESEGRAVVLAIGAPRDSTAGRVPRTCPDCGESEFLDTVMVEGRLMVQCPACDGVFESGLH